jgi:hypothetical protein
MAAAGTGRGLRRTSGEKVTRPSVTNVAPCNRVAYKERLTIAKLIYSAITSLDGYVAVEDGNFDWAVPDEEVHTFINDLERPIGTYLYRRRTDEVMVAWETAHPPRPAAPHTGLQDASGGIQRQDADRAGLRP